MLKLHIPAKIGLLAALLSAASFADDRFVVKVNGDVNQVARRNRLTVVKSLAGSATGIYVLSAPKGADHQRILSSLAADPGVQRAEAENVVMLPGSKTQKPPVTPSGNSKLKLDGTAVWYYNSFAAAAYINQQAGQIIKLPKSLPLATGNSVKVALIDTGIDRTHPVLAPSVIEGYDFVNKIPGGQEQFDLNQETTPILDQETTPILDQETTPILDGGTAVILRQETTPILDQETTPILDFQKYPSFGHGTATAGLVHLVAPRAKLMPVRCFAANGTATISQVIAGIHWAIDRGANVINASWSTSSDSPLLADAIKYAIDAGVTFVAAAGNSGHAVNAYPASYSTVVGVGCTDSFNVRCFFSNYDAPPQIMPAKLAAPGMDVITTFPFNHYAQVEGTSFSAPLATGGAALVVQLSKDISPANAMKALQHADAIGNQGLGAGELDLYLACLAVGGGNNNNGKGNDH